MWRELPSIYLFSVEKGKCVAAKYKYFMEASTEGSLSSHRDKNELAGVETVGPNANG
jgi:hypothetical protein